MKSKLLYLVAPLIFTLILGGIYLLYNDTHVFGSVQFSTSKNNIISLSETLLESLGVSTSSYTANVNFRQNDDLIRQVQSEIGLSSGNTVLRERLPGFYWDLRWLPESSFFGRSEEPDSTTWISIKNFRLHYDTHGNLIFFSREIPDSVHLPALSQSQAREIALQFIQKFMPSAMDDFESDSVVNRGRVLVHDQNRNASQRAEYDFEWKLKKQQLSNNISLKASVSGNILKEVEVDYAVPDVYDSETDQIIFIILIVVFFVSITILTIVLAFKKSRNYEINFKIAIYLGIIITIIYAIQLLLQSEQTQSWGFIISLIIVPGFTGGIFIVVWAVSESMVRETWKEKFIPLDLLIKSHFMHSRIGQGIIQGLVAGALVFFVSRLLVWFGSNVTTITATVRSDWMFDFFSSINPVFFLVSHNSWSVLYVLTINFILLITYLYSRTGSKVLTYILAVFPLTVMMGSFVEPIYFGLLFDALALLILIWLFFKSDILAIFFALFTYATVEVGFSFLNTSHDVFTGSALILAAGFLALFIYAFLAIFTRDLVQDLSEIEPAMSRFISERQRMQQQLEVARQVQMSFLPDKTPQVSGLDLAARCLPAYEVGGDYFDFIRLDPQRLGVAIGVAKRFFKSACQIS
jgi:sigma-B regulation protein RsbU (phosphoserine phosphatase)